MKVCCDTEGRELTDERRYAPTSVPLRRKPCSRSPETLFHFTGIPTLKAGPRDLDDGPVVSGRPDRGVAVGARMSEFPEACPGARTPCVPSRSKTMPYVSSSVKWQDSSVSGSDQNHVALMCQSPPLKSRVGDIQVWQSGSSDLRSLLREYSFPLFAVRQATLRGPGSAGARNPLCLVAALRLRAPLLAIGERCW